MGGRAAGACWRLGRPVRVLTFAAEVEVDGFKLGWKIDLFTKRKKERGKGAEVRKAEMIGTGRK